MTTEITPPPETHRTLRADQPAELLAAARLAFGTVPRDCLLMAGHSGCGTPPILTSSPVAEMLLGSGREHLEHHLTLLRERGRTAAVALLVIGDGTSPVDDDELAEWLGGLAPMVLDTAARMLPEPFPLHPLWVLGGGTVHQVLLERDEASAGGSVWISPPEDLPPFDRTHVAMEAVLEGRSVRQDLPGRQQLRCVGDRLELRPDPTASAADTAAMFSHTRTAVSRLGASTPRGRTQDEQFMTDCEQLGAMLSALAVDAVHWELLALCADRGSARSIDRESLLQQLTSDPSLRPHSDVCAGGDWYTTIELLREAAAAAMNGADPVSASVATAAWRGLTAVLSLLSWWNHRFAAAGELVDDLATRDPGSTLAPLLATLIDTPIVPAWWPET